MVWVRHPQRAEAGGRTIAESELDAVHRTANQNAAHADVFRHSAPARLRRTAPPTLKTA